MMAPKLENHKLTLQLSTIAKYIGSFCISSKLISYLENRMLKVLEYILG